MLEYAMHKIRHFPILIRAALLGCLLVFAAGPLLAGGTQAQDRATRQAAERLMDTLALEKRVDSILQLYIQLAPQNTAADAERARLLREKSPGAGKRFRGAVAKAAAQSYSAPELTALDGYFASDEGQRTLTTALGRALFAVGRGNAVKKGDLLRPEDFANRPGLERVADKYPGFEAAAVAELSREFASEIALLVLK